MTDLPVQLGLDHDIHTILIVDDEPDELHLFARMIESDPHGYSVFQTNDGRRALTILQARKPDLILLDLIMPVLDGYGVLREMQKNSDLRDIPVVVISSRDPAGEAINMNTVRVSYKNGFSTRNLLEFIQAVMRIFLPGG